MGKVASKWCQTCISS